MRSLLLLGTLVCGATSACFDDASSECVGGEAGCPCLADGSCADDLQCGSGTCMSMGCTLGALDCPCDNGTCSGAAACVGGLCTSEAQTGGTPPMSSTSDEPLSTSTGDDPGTSSDSSTGGAADTSGGASCSMLRHYVFASQRMSGDFGGHAGADAACQAQADAEAQGEFAGLTWKGVLATAEEPAREYIEVCADVWLVAGPNGLPAQVATEQTWWTSNHSLPIDRTFDGTLLLPQAGAWTGMFDASGTNASRDTCSDFTQSGLVGAGGDPHLPMQWAVSLAGPFVCSGEFSVYCISQPPG